MTTFRAFIYKGKSRPLSGPFIFKGGGKVMTILGPFHFIRGELKVMTAFYYIFILFGGREGSPSQVF